MTRWCVGLGWTAVALLGLSSPALAQNVLTPFSKATSDKAPAPWRAAGLPKGRAPLAVFDVVTLDNAKVLRLRTEKTYGTVVHDIADFVPTANTTLKWRWRLDEPVPNANLRAKSGDDAALKVCVLYNMPTDVLSFSERMILSIARTLIDPNLPAATLCYVWDVTLPAGTLLSNAHTKRIKYLVLDGQGSEGSLGTWKSHERHVAQDFMKAFGHETQTMPPVTAIAAGADSDSTKSSSLAYVGDIVLEP
jgi:hypothetical protein